MCAKCQFLPDFFDWCKRCKLNHFRLNYGEFPSGNNEIDDILKDNYCKSKSSEEMIEWIPYNQFYDIKEMGKDNFSTLYSAIWMNDSLNYKVDKNGKKIWEKKPNKEVILKCSHNSQNITSEFLNEV